MFRYAVLALCTPACDCKRPGRGLRGRSRMQHPHFFERHFLKKEGTPPPGKPRWIPHTDERAGYPRSLSGHLETSRTAGGIGYYVGGGVPCGRGEGRRPIDGTWGWDETGMPAFSSSHDPGMVAGAQVSGRHRCVSHRRACDAGPDLRDRQHDQQFGAEERFGVKRRAGDAACGEVKDRSGRTSSAL